MRDSLLNSNAYQRVHHSKLGTLFASITSGKFYYLTCSYPRLSRREISAQLKRIGVKEPSSPKIYLRDFEKYIEINYGKK